MKLKLSSSTKTISSVLGISALIIFIALMFYYGMTAGSAWSVPDIATSSTIKVEAVEYDVEVEDQFGNRSLIIKGSSATFEGEAPSFIRIIGQASDQAPANVAIAANEGLQIEDPSLFDNGQWFRDVSFTGIDKVATIDRPHEQISLFASSTRTPSENRPEVGDVFTGKGSISYVSQNGTGGSVNFVTFVPSSGILQSFPGIRSYCSDHSAGAPYVGQKFNYTYTITYVNKKTGEVKGSFYATPTTGATDGVSTDSSGNLTGYQRINAIAGITRDYCGFIRLKKVSTAPSMTSSNPLYSLDGATYRIYEDKSCKQRSEYGDIVSKAGEYVKSEPIAAGVYYVKEIKASKGFELSSKVHKVEVEPEKTSDVGIEIDGSTVVTEVPRHNPSKFVLGKFDNDSNEGWAQGDSSLQGAQYRVDYYAGQHTTIKGAQDSGDPKRHWVFASDSNGKINMCNESYLLSGTLYKNRDGDIAYPLGTYIIYEIQPSQGYLLSDEKVHIRIMKDPDSDGTIFKGNVIKGSSISGSGNAYSSYANVIVVKEPPLKGSVEIEKRDTVTGSSPQGDSKFNETTFEIRNLSRNAVLFEGKKIDPGGIICELAIPEDSNKVSMPQKSLPFGTYSILETKAGEGYKIGEEEAKSFVITADGQICHFTEDSAFKNSPETGFACITKKDRLSDDGDAQGDATLEGTWFEITNKSRRAIFFDGSLFEKDETITTLQTDANGSCPKVELPYGTYSIEETRASEGYLLSDTQPKTISIRNNGESIAIEFANDPICGSLKLEKRDIETGEAAPLGKASLEATRFEVTNLSRAKIKIYGETYLPNEVCATLFTNKEGLTSMAEKTLPYGTYSVAETSASEGYLLTDSKVRTFTIRADGEVAFFGKEVDEDESVRTEDAAGENRKEALSKKGDAFYNQVMRQDLAFIKVHGVSSERLSDIPFEIVSKTTGERHVVVTDENGEVHTEAAWNAHSKNTNANDFATSTSETNNPPTTNKLDRYAGVWWGITESGTPALPNDSLCALVYDDYVLRELPVDKNAKFELVEFEFSVNRDNLPINLGTIENKPPEIDPDPSIATNAIDAQDGDKLAYASNKCKLIDRVDYMNLRPGESYELHATLIDAETLQQIPGTQTKLEFTPSSVFGSVGVELVCDTLPVAGRDVVFFEELLFEDEVVCSHKDADDSAQKVTIIKPEVVTYAHDSHDGDKTVAADIASSVTDDVKLENLEPDISYTLYGIVMNADTSIPAITKCDNENEAPAEDELGEFWNGLLKLLGADSKTSEDGYICDIAYSSKIDKAALKEYLSSNSKVANAVNIVSKEFTATSSSMTTSLDYSLESNRLEGSYVIFDLLLNDDTVVAVHADTSNEDQSFEVMRPHISTTATDKTDNDHNILPSKEAKVTDRVEYGGLVTGVEYEIFGTLIDKRSGKALCINDKIVESSAKFIPNSPSGSVDVNFVFDASSLEDGSTFVAFEHLKKDGRTIAEHTDLYDQEQSVKISTITSKETSSGESVPKGGLYYKTGYASNETPLATFAISIIIITAFLVYRRFIQNGRIGNDAAHTANKAYK